ncbi:MAG: hypothetical protein QOK39_1858, partial [Acidimicrobiaceae bacterium]|nr:hypothetical protein [Acidimicrobiaceae bacterium]
MKLAKPLLGAVAASVLAGGAWAAVPAGAASRPSVTAAPAAATAAALPASPGSCEAEHWPDRATGQPAGLEAGAATGFYLW